MLSPDRRSTWHHGSRLAVRGVRGEMSAWLGVAYALIQVLGLLAAGKAVMEARTAQGATAWAVALVAFPLLALPLFLVFGQHRFHDYVAARRNARRRLPGGAAAHAGSLAAARPARREPLHAAAGAALRASFHGRQQRRAAGRRCCHLRVDLRGHRRGPPLRAGPVLHPARRRLGTGAARAAARARCRRRAGAPAVRQGRQLRPAEAPTSMGCGPPASRCRRPSAAASTGCT